MTSSVLSWSHAVRADDVPEHGLRFELAPDAAMRAALAKLAGIEAVQNLTAAFDVSRHGRNGLRVTGQVTATVDQICVVTLEPMQSAVAERFDILFLPPKAADSAVEAADDPDAEDVEPLVEGTADLGAIGTEFLLLGIDPYPRKPEAVFAAPEVAAGGEHPFAALAALKKDSGG